MKVAVFGKKYENNIEEFLINLRSMLLKNGIMDEQIDTSYFDTDIDSDYENTQKRFNSIKKTIFSSDVLIIESSCKSEGISFVTGFALALNKPTLILYDKTVRTDIRSLSTILLGTKALKRAFLKKYSLKDQQEFDDIVCNFLKEANGLIESKFYIILPPEINRYLEWWSYENRRPKVNKIRELLNRDLSENSEWNDFIK